MSSVSDLLDLLLEVQALDRVPRTGFLLRGVADAESVAEHAWQVAFLVWTLAARVDGLDRGRAVQMALVHDLAELRLGDLPMTAARLLPDGAKAEAERRALAELLGPLDEAGRDLAAEYLEGRSPEARFVRACDKLQLMVKVAAYEAWGAAGLAEFWDDPRNSPDGGFELIRDLHAALRERRGLRSGS